MDPATTTSEWAGNWGKLQTVTMTFLRFNDCGSKITKCFPFAFKNKCDCKYFCRKKTFGLTSKNNFELTHIPQFFAAGNLASNFFEMLTFWRNLSTEVLFLFLFLPSKLIYILNIGAWQSFVLCLQTPFSATLGFVYLLLPFEFSRQKKSRSAQSLLTLEVFAGGWHVGDNVSNESKDGGKRGEPNDKLEYHKQVLRPRLGSRQVACQQTNKLLDLDLDQSGIGNPYLSLSWLARSSRERLGKSSHCPHVQGNLLAPRGCLCPLQT